MRAILFDLDGTLVDTLEDIGTSMNAALRALGQPEHPMTHYRLLVGEGVRRLAERAAPRDRHDLADALVTEFRRIYAEHLLDRTRPYPEVPRLLDLLEARALPAAVLSNKPDAATRRIVEALLGRWTWAKVAGERPGIPRKPNPMAALGIAQDLGVQPAEMLFVGDSEIDMQTAAAAGMVAVGVAWGFRSPSELEAAGARRIIHRAEAMMDILRA